MYSQLIVFAVLVCWAHCYDDWVYQTIRDAEAKQEAVDACGICTKLTESFAKVRVAYRLIVQKDRKIC